MPFSNEVFSDAPIILHHLETSPDTPGEIPEAMKSVADLVEMQEHPVYIVIDLRQIKIGLDDLIANSSRAARGPNALMHHPNVIETLFVVSNLFMKMGLMGMSSEVFGNARLRTFDTVEHALEYCHQKIAETSEW